MFTYSTTVKLHQTDAAGLLFFGNYFMLAHDAYQAFVEASGYSFARIIKESGFLAPIVHAESDYQAPLFVGDKVEVRLSADDIGTTSYTLAYELVGENGATVATLRTVHVWVERRTMQKSPLPGWLKDALAKIR
ncbi:MAG TPA: thioesterase family protein [Candidatus Acidoferrum sp.]|nr:thioesterase family protein [Candidatus Acidoferrum sp.]